MFYKGYTKGEDKNDQLFGVITSYAGKWDKNSAFTAMCDPDFDGTVIGYENLLQ